MAWDQDALLARSGDASKYLQSLVDKLRARQTSESCRKLSKVHRTGRKPAVRHLRRNMLPLRRQADLVRHADERTHLRGSGLRSCFGGVGGYGGQELIQ